MRAVSQKNPYNFINTFSTVLFLLFLFSGCTYLGLKDSPATPSHTDVKRSYFLNGNLEYEAEFINEKLDGTSQVWSEDGTLLSVSEYSNGQPHGVWKTFYPKEKLKYETTYFHSRKHGYERYYYENGQLKSEQKFSYGKSETEIVRWNVDGTILY